jgi:hypothetical protein
MSVAAPADSGLRHRRLVPIPWAGRTIHWRRTAIDVKQAERRAPFVSPGVAYDAYRARAKALVSLLFRTLSPTPPTLMAAPVDTHLITVIGVAALIGWRVFARIRRTIGRQRLSPARPWLTVVLLPLILLLVLFTNLVHPLALAAVGAGAALGIGLGLFGTRLTRFEATPAGLFYTPNAHLGIALSLLLVLRLGYRFVLLELGGPGVAPQSMQLGSSPLTLAIFATLAGYYVTYAVGLLRWRARVGSQMPAEH